MRSLGRCDAIARDSATWHTSLYDRAWPRPWLRDRVGVCLCKCYDSIDNMVEATCLWVWDFTTHKHLDLWADDEDPSQLIIRPGWDAPHVRCFLRVFCASPCLLRQVGTTLGSPYDCIKTGITYADPGSGKSSPTSDMLSADSQPYHTTLIFWETCNTKVTAWKWVSTLECTASDTE